MKVPDSSQIAYCIADIETIKHAALFYDSVVSFPFEAVRNLQHGVVSSQQAASEIFEVIPQKTFQNLLGPIGYFVLMPNEFGMAGHRFRSLFLIQLMLLHEFSRKTAQGQPPSNVGIPGEIEVGEFGFEPVLVMPETLMKDSSATDNDITVAIRGARLIDTSKATWEQITEIRSNAESLKKLRNLRLFLQTNYSGKSRNFVEDDLGKRLDDYENVVKDYGLETLRSTLTMVADSKSLLSFGAAGFAALLFGEPFLASASLVGGVSLEIAKISLEISKRRHSFNKIRRDHELGYILDVRNVITDGSV